MRHYFFGSFTVAICGHLKLKRKNVGSHDNREKAGLFLYVLFVRADSGFVR